MGPLEEIIPILGVLAGLIVAFLAKSEMKPGQKYFQISQHVLLGVIVGALAWNFGYSTAIAAGVLVFALLWLAKFSHPIEFIPILSIPAVLSQNSQIPIFLYLIPTATLHRTELKELFIISIIYLILVLTASMPF